MVVIVPNPIPVTIPFFVISSRAAPAQNVSLRIYLIDQSAGGAQLIKIGKLPNFNNIVRVICQRSVKAHFDLIDQSPIVAVD